MVSHRKFLHLQRSDQTKVTLRRPKEGKFDLLGAVVAASSCIKRPTRSKKVPLYSMFKLSQSISGGNEEQGESLLGEESGGFCSLSPMQRIYGFAACLLAGLVCMLLSMIVFAKPIKFAVLFTFGNLIAVGSTAFLLGPAQQIEMMFDPVRVFATAVYLGCVVIALICALWIRSKVLTILAIISEICALLWYSLSYIPFARRMVSELMIRLCDTEL